MLITVKFCSFSSIEGLTFWIVFFFPFSFSFPIICVVVDVFFSFQTNVVSKLAKRDDICYPVSVFCLNLCFDC